MREARYYHPTEKGVQCDLCPHECNISEGKRGICGSRVCLDGKLWSEVYGNPCAIAIDPVEKKPLMQFHPGTKCYSIACTGCNFHCLNCQNFEISQAKPSEVESVLISPEDLVEACISAHCPSIAYTYTEPLTYFEYIYDTAHLAREKGLYNILVSAGYVNQEPLSELAPMLDAANIDLKSFSNDIYKKISGGTLQPVLDTLLLLKNARVHLEITNLLIPTINDDMSMIRNMCKWLASNGFSDCPLHFSRFFPRFKMTNLPPTPVDTLKKARDIASEEGIKSIYLGNI
jgi:pyruvate formate lyase activating enzyme